MAQQINPDAFLVQIAHTQQQIADVLGAMQHNNAGGGNSSGLKPQLPLFYGKRGEDNVRKFRAQIETACNATNTRIDRRVAIATAQLRGAASEWWFSLLQVEGRDYAQVISMDEFFQLLEENFMPDNYSEYVYNALEKLQQTSNIYDYIDKFSNLANQLHGIVNDFVLIRHFTKGLKPQTQYQVKANNPQSLQQAYNVATHYDSAYTAVHADMRRRQQQRPTQHNRPQVTQQHRTQPTTNMPTPMELDQLKMQQQRFNGQGQKASVNIADIECFKCHQKGHYAYKCPNKKGNLRVNDVELEEQQQHEEENEDVNSDCEDPGNDMLLSFM